MSDLLLPPASFRDQAVDAFILSSNHVLALGIQILLDDWSDRITCHRLDPPDNHGAYPTFVPDVLILAPQNWQDLAAWLPTMRRRFRCSAWLLFTEPRIAGLFISLLDQQPCKLIPDTATPEELRSAALVLGTAPAGHLTSQVLTLFARDADRDAYGSERRNPSAVEVQCGCAVSLGLSNRQIASVLHLSQATVKSHLYRLGRKLGLSSRQEVGSAIHQSLSGDRWRIHAS